MSYGTGSAFMIYALFTHTCEKQLHVNVRTDRKERNNQKQKQKHRWHL